MTNKSTINNIKQGSNTAWYESVEYVNFTNAYPPSRFPFYEKAAQTGDRASKRYLSSVWPKLFPLPLDDDYDFDSLELYDKGDGKWLLGCKKGIRTALKAGDEAFFLKLARMIQMGRQQRKKTPESRTSATSAGAPTPQRCSKHRLWR